MGKNCGAMGRSEIKGSKYGPTGCNSFGDKGSFLTDCSKIGDGNCWPVGQELLEQW